MADVTDVVPQDPKSILQSKTFWGMVLGIGAPILAMHGVVVDPTGWAVDITTLIGFILALYGRFTATQPVTFRK